MGLRLLLFFSFFFLFFFFSHFSFFSITQPSSAGRGPFASLARGQPSHRAFVIIANATIHAWFSFRVIPWLMLLLSSCLLMRVCLKTERLRWGSPTATAPFAPLDFGLCAFITRSLSLSKGRTNIAL